MPRPKGSVNKKKSKPVMIDHPIKNEETWDYWGGYGADGADYCQSLYETAVHFKAKKVLEIGFRLGKSSLAFLKSGCNVVSVDIEVADDFDAVSLIKEQGYFDLFTFIQGRSDDIMPRFLPNSFDLVYIDGSHVLRDIISDYRNALNVVKEGGVIVFDDWRKDLGYNTETQEAFNELGLEYKTMTDFGITENPHGAAIIIK